MQKFIFRLLCGFVALVVIILSIKLSINPLGVLDGKVVSAQSVPNIGLVPVTTAVSSAIYLTHSRDGSGRLFIAEQSGIIRVILPGAIRPLVTPFLDIRSKVLVGGEWGLLGLAFHPQYITNRRFFVNYTRISDGATVISEFTASDSNPNIAETNEKIILTIEQPFSNNNGGMIEFGPDGYLYIGMGDGGAGNDPGDRAQNIDELLGKMLRIDVDHASGAIPYSSPSDNPFFGPIPGRDEIYAMGFRNPFRWSFDRSTGQLYAGDVGEDAKEEIDIVTRGGNYGWRVFEGTNCTSLGPAPCDPGLFTPPIYEYDHSDNHCSVIGGYVYRGSRGTLPAGSYIFGDYCTGDVFMLNNDTITLLANTFVGLSSFGEDEAGELYVVNLNGVIYRITSLGSATTVSEASNFGSPLARASLASGFGNGLANSTQVADIPFLTDLGGATVTVKDSSGVIRSAFISFVSPSRINFQIPQDLTPGNATITYTNTIIGTISSSSVTIGDVNPGLFSANESGGGIANSLVLRRRPGLPDVYEPTYRIKNNHIIPIPIDLGPPTDQVFLILYGTGFRFRSSLSAVSVRVGETICDLSYAGVGENQRLGVDQANILLPRSLAGRGRVNIVMTADGLTSNKVQVIIR